MNNETDKSGVRVDLHLRLHDFLDEKSISISRVGDTYYLSDHVRLTAGYSYIRDYSVNDDFPDMFPSLDRPKG